VTEQQSVLFVCLGNICRSPLAEAAFSVEMARRGFAVRVDSAGTSGWHAGEPPDWRALKVARRHGTDIAHYRGGQITQADFSNFNHIVALDLENLSRLRAMRPPNATASLSLLLDFVAGREGQAVADPFYGDIADFETTWTDVSLAAAGLARHLFGTE
ncbi:MAG: low molecular weight protein-tyrosine-phosphatase, partial [Rhodospirillales bacterium]